MSNPRDLARQARHEEQRAENWLRLSRAMARLDVSRGTLMKFIECKKLVAEKLPNGHWRVTESSVAALLNETRRAS